MRRRQRTEQKAEQGSWIKIFWWCSFRVLLKNEFDRSANEKAVNAHGAFTAQKADMTHRFRPAGTGNGLLYSIALHLRDSPPDIVRRPSKEKRSRFFPLRRCPLSAPEDAASNMERTDEPRASILGGIITASRLFVKRPKTLSPRLTKNDRKPILFFVLM